MFSTNKSVYVGNEKCLIESVCLSTDTKPTDGIANGSKCTEMDTGDIYMFDEAGGEWIKLGSGGGGDAEVWLVGDAGVEQGGKMIFALSNVDATDHITELFNNSSNYILYINDDTELTFNEEYSTEDNKMFVDSALTVAISVAIVDTQGYASAVFENASTAPDSVEVSVKEK